MNTNFLDRIIITLALLLTVSLTYGQEITTNTGFDVLAGVPIDQRTVINTLSDTTTIDWAYEGLYTHVKDTDEYWRYTGTQWELFQTAGLNNFYISNDTLYAVSTDSTYSVLLPYALQLADSTTLLRSLIDLAGAQYIDTLQLQGDTLLQISLFGDNQPLKELNLSALSGDNLGNHIMTQNLVTNGNWISGDGGNEGIGVDAAGKVGIGTTTPSYILDINSTNSAVKFPVTTSLPLGTPGLLTYSPDSTSFLAYYNAQWNRLVDHDYLSSNYITAEANDLTSSVTWTNVPDANITESSVNQWVEDSAYGAGWNGDLSAPTKNSIYDKIETLGVPAIANRAVVIGSGTGIQNISGFNFNTAGTLEWYSATGSSNLGAGTSTLSNLDASSAFNSGFGPLVMGSAVKTNIDQNSGFGAYALQYLTTGDNNTSSGAISGNSLTSGSDNTFTGTYSGFNLTTGSGNVFSGSFSGYNDGAQTHSNMIATGYQAGYNVDILNSESIFIGSESGKNESTYQDLILIGAQSQADQSNQIVIGHQKSGYESTQLKVGNYRWNIDQTVGAGQDNYVMTYDNASGELRLEEAASISELNDLSSVVTWDTIPDLYVQESSITQHQAALSILETQITDLNHFTNSDIDTSLVATVYSLEDSLSNYLTSEVNDLSSIVTWDTIPDLYVQSSSVVQHEGDLTIDDIPANRIPYGTGTALTSESGFTYDGSNMYIDYNDSDSYTWIRTAFGGTRSLTLNDQSTQSDQFLSLSNSAGLYWTIEPLDSAYSSKEFYISNGLKMSLNAGGKYYGADFFSFGTPNAAVWSYKGVDGGGGTTKFSIQTHTNAQTTDDIADASILFLQTGRWGTTETETVFNETQAETRNHPNADETLGSILFGTRVDEGFNAVDYIGAAIYAETPSDWTGSSTPAYITFATTQSGSASSPVRIMTLNETQDVVLNSYWSANKIETSAKYVMAIDTTDGRLFKISTDSLGGTGSGGASQLSDLSDVNTSAPTNKNVLIADGVDWESRALVEADISDLSHSGNGIFDAANDDGTIPATFEARLTDILYFSNSSGTEFMTINGSTQQVGIGTTPSTGYGLSIGKNQNATIGTIGDLALGSSIAPSSASSSTFNGIVSAPTISGTNNITGHISAAVLYPYNTSSGTLSNVFGLKITPVTLAGNIVNMKSLFIQPNRIVGGTVTNVTNIELGLVGSGYTNYSGIKILNTSAATTAQAITIEMNSGANKYAIYSGGSANSYFAGDIGINDSSPDYDLDINGTLGVTGTVRFEGYGQGNKEVGDLALTNSGYLATYATNGTLMEIGLTNPYGGESSITGVLDSLYANQGVSATSSELLYGTGTGITSSSALTYSSNTLSVGVPANNTDGALVVGNYSTSSQYSQNVNIGGAQYFETAQKASPSSNSDFTALYLSTWKHDGSSAWPFGSLPLKKGDHLGAVAFGGTDSTGTVKRPIWLMSTADQVTSGRVDGIFGVYTLPTLLGLISVDTTNNAIMKMYSKDLSTHFYGNVHIENSTIIDENLSGGNTGEVLSKTATGVDWVDPTLRRTKLLGEFTGSTVINPDTLKVITGETLGTNYAILAETTNDSLVLSFFPAGLAPMPKSTVDIENDQLIVIDVSESPDKAKRINIQEVVGAPTDKQTPAEAATISLNANGLMNNKFQINMTNVTAGITVTFDNFIDGGEYLVYFTNVSGTDEITLPSGCINLQGGGSTVSFLDITQNDYMWITYDGTNYYFHQ